MRNDITEFSFAYTFTEEFVGFMDHEIDFAPYIPNLKEEGKVHYDLQLSWGIPLFIQFKLSEYIKLLSLRVREYRLGHFTSPFYRFELRTEGHNEQHNKLVALNRSGKVVSYVAPIFNELDDFNDFYLNQQIIDNSIILEPKTIGEYNDGKKHHISFSSQNNFRSYSEPKYLEGVFDFRHFRARVMDGILALRDEQKTPGETYWVKLERTMLEIIRKHDVIMGDRIMYNHNAPLPDRINYLSRAYFNCEMFLAFLKT